RGEPLSPLAFRLFPPRGEQANPIVVVALAARVAPGLSLDDARCVLLGSPAPRPGPPSRWWGVDQSDWFGRERGEAPHGLYFDEVSVAAGRFRIPPREIEEMLPQQALMLAVAAEAFGRTEGDESLRRRTGAYVGVSLDPNTTNFHLRWALNRHDPDLA